MMIGPGHMRRGKLAGAEDCACIGTSTGSLGRGANGTSMPLHAVRVNVCRLIKSLLYHIHIGNACEINCANIR